MSYGCCEFLVVEQERLAAANTIWKGRNTDEKPPVEGENNNCKGEIWALLLHIERK